MSTNRQTTLRIIGGKWRGRKLKVCQRQYIRPTPNRVRETVFNWLAPVIHGSVCLDLFAGSGALGFEALSRGAKHVMMVDKSIDVINTLQANATILGTKDIEFLCQEFKKAGVNPAPALKFDIVFLDPPFYKGFIAPCCNWLEQNNILTKNAFVYVEAEKNGRQMAFPENWETYKHKISGQVDYSLFRGMCCKKCSRSKN